MGGMADGPYHQMGREIMAESEQPEISPNDQAAMQALDMVNQMLDSGEFPGTDGGIQAAIAEAAKRVYAETGMEVDPKYLAEALSEFTDGEYAQSDVTGEEIANPGPANKNPMAQRRPLPKPQQ